MYFSARAEGRISYLVGRGIPSAGAFDTWVVTKFAIFD